MPDYSKTVIYKIQHEDNKELVYIGSTTNFTERKSCHKNVCNNQNNNRYNTKLYQMIRDNGGWECFRMVQIKEFSCNNKREAEAEEDNIMLEFKANMNDHRASRTDKQYRLDNKDNKKEYDKIYRLNNADKIKEKIKEKVECDCGCEVVKHHLTRHKKSTKHQGRILLQQTI